MVATKGTGAKKVENEEDEKCKQEAEEVASLLVQMSSQEWDAVLEGQKGVCVQDCLLYASSQQKRALPLCSLGVGTLIVSRAKHTDIYLK